MQKLLKKLSKIASSLLSLAIISSSLFIAIPPEEASALIPAGQKDMSFDTGSGVGANGTVRSLIIDSTDKILIGGDFTLYNGTARNRIARLNINGSPDTTFNVGEGANNTVRSIFIQPDGKILIGGGFTQYNGTNRNHIARLNSDGSLDTAFNPGTGANNIVWSVVTDSDGKILIAGQFSEYNGTGRNRIARLNSDGSLDTTFNPGTGANNIVRSVVTDSDGKILIAGQFSEYNGTGRNRIARLNSDGSLDTTFNPGTGANNIVGSVVTDSDGKILIAGQFSEYNGTGRNRIARLNGDGSLDTNFNPGTGVNGSTVDSVIAYANGKIFIGGSFSSYNGTLRSSIARLNSDGSLDTTFNPSYSLTGMVFSTATTTDGRILLGGTISSFDQLARGNIVSLTSDGSLDATFDPGTGVSGSVNSMVIDTNGKTSIVGSFYLANSMVRSIARLNSDGSFDTTFNPGTGPNSGITSIVTDADGKIFIGGMFTSYNGTLRNRIARLNSDGSLDTTFNPGTMGGSINSPIIIDIEGKILFGAGHDINRLNNDGSFDTSFNPGTGPNNVVTAIDKDSDGKILIGGSFTSYNGIARNRIARLNTNGSLDTTFNVGEGANNTVRTIFIQPDGKILIGGDFTLYNGTARNRIARLNVDGTLDTTFNVGSGANDIVRKFSIQSNGKVIIGGGFTQYNGTNRNHIARLNSDGSLDTTFNPGTGGNNIVWSVVTDSDGEILIGGQFTIYNGIPSPSIIRLYSNALYQADNLDPSLDVAVNGTSLKVGTTNGSTNPSEQVTLKATGNVPLSDFTVDFSGGDVDFSGVTAGSDAASGKAFLSGLNNTAIPELSPTHTLYIPKLVGQTSVHICPDATQMSEVFMGCSNGYTLNYGGASNLSIVNISGQDYWRVTGLTGTGGLGTYSNGVSLTITPNNGLESVAQEVDVTYTSGGGFVNGDVIQLTWDAGITLANCATPTTDADGDLTNDGSSSVVGQTYTYTYTGNATSSVDLCMSVAGLSGNYAVTLNDDNGSFSSALYYINPEGGDVNVIANIAPTLSFNIRNIDDSADLNVCNFGDVSTSTPIPNTNGTVDSGECGYSLAVGTNSSSGFTMQMSSNGALTNGVSNINNVLNNGTWSAGEEAYGIAQVIVGQTGRDPLSGDYDQSLTREGNFLTDTTPVPTTATDFVTYTDGVQYEAGNLDTDVTKVIHGLVVGAGTPAGSYSQVVTYTVTASF
jgi:uncharacterized delta-60 repeat protein